MFNRAMNDKLPANLGQFLAQLQGNDPQPAPMQQMPSMGMGQAPMQQPLPMQQGQAPSMPPMVGTPNPSMGGIFGRSPSQRPSWKLPEGTPGESRENPRAITKKTPFFQRDSTRDGLASFADTLIKLRSGIDPGLMRDRTFQKQQQFAESQYERKRLAEYDDAMRERGWEVQDAQDKRNAPQFFMSNGDRVMLNPSTGQTTVLYDGQEPFEDYAQALGIEPGTDEYTTALQDYVLKSSGPTAYDYDVRLDSVRTGNDIQRKQAPTYRQSNPIPRAGRSARKSGGASRRPTATGPGGKRIEWNGSAWVPKN
tara:strand:+ start:3309 stop:4238 length:930 start_codon:yes stop_codon:yes gene_type:complete